MPIYLYQNPKTQETIEVIQSVNDTHEYIDNSNLKWDRIFTVPEVNSQGSLDVNCDAKKFSEFTANKKGTVGDIWDRSAELSEKRKKIYGEDPVKKKYYSDWSKKRKGKVHPNSHSD
jgi:predicted nucleic acid-binding Zn ribbon protein